VGAADLEPDSRHLAEAAQEVVVVRAQACARVHAFDILWYAGGGTGGGRLVNERAGSRSTSSSCWYGGWTSCNGLCKEAAG
jgi:hypothetical protein